MSTNRHGYDLWSTNYDTTLNPTVAMDDAHFPALYAGVQGRRVLELGCGTGRHTVRLAAQGNRVLGLDLSPGMLAVAREKVRAFAGVELREADFMAKGRAKDFSADVLGGQFDVVIESLVLEHIGDLGEFFRRVSSVLAPGGELLLSELHPARTAQGVAAHFKLGEDEVRLVSFPHTADEIERAARGAGLELRERIDLVADERFCARHEKWAKYLGTPMVQMWRLRK